LLSPDYTGALLFDGFDEKFATALKDAAVSNFDELTLLPASHHHLVSGAKGTNFGSAGERSAHSSTLIRVELQSHRICHPLNVGLKITEFGPDF